MSATNRAYASGSNPTYSVDTSTATTASPTVVIAQTTSARAANDPATTSSAVNSPQTAYSPPERLSDRSSVRATSHQPPGTVPRERRTDTPQKEQTTDKNAPDSPATAPPLGRE